MLVHADLSNCLRRELDQAGWEVLREQANREIKKSRCTAEKIIEVRKQPRAGRKLSEWSREQGVSMASTCARKSKYAGLAVSQLKRLKWQEPG